MQENPPSNYIYLARPDLIKEWHPTKNGKSNPRNVTCDHAEELWWLCENGHEWKATVKSRMVGDRCPLCVTELVEEESQEIGEHLQQQKFKSNNDQASENRNDLFQEDSDKSYTGVEFRKYKRYKYKTTAMLEDLSSENRTYAQMKNISRQGMCFETSAAFTPGGKVRIMLDSPLFKSKSKGFRSAVTTVRWCNKLTDEEGYAYAYGLGLQLK